MRGEVSEGKQLGLAKFGGRAVRLSREGRVIAIEIVTQHDAKITGVLFTLRLSPQELNRLADVIDEVATDVEEADGLDEGARDHENRSA